MMPFADLHARRHAERHVLKMPWCPVCKKEYKEEQTFCAKCGSMLLSKSPNENRNGTEVEDVPAFLITVGNGVEADMLNARLESSNIPCYIKPHDNGGLLRVYMGPPNVGADFYVPSKLLERAKQALDIEQDEEYTDDFDNTDSEISGSDHDTSSLPFTDKFTSTEHNELEPRTGNRIRQRFIAVGVLILVLLAYFSLDAILDLLRKLLGY